MPIKKPVSTTEQLFGHLKLNESNSSIMEQIEVYKKVADIYDRTQYALGRKLFFKTANCATDNIKVTFYGSGTTNKI